MNITSSAPAAAPAANARAADGDFKTKGLGHEVRDTDGDYRPAKATPSVQGASTSSAAATSSNGVLAALMGLRNGGD